MICLKIYQNLRRKDEEAENLSLQKDTEAIKMPEPISVSEIENQKFREGRNFENLKEDIISCLSELVLKAPEREKVESCRTKKSEIINEKKRIKLKMI